MACTQTIASVCTKKDEDIENHFNQFENDVEVTENNGGELVTEEKLLSQDKRFSELSQVDKENEDNIEASKERTREKFLSCKSLAGHDKK